MRYFAEKINILLLFTSILIVLVGIFSYFYFVYADKVTPGVFLENTYVGGMTQSELEEFFANGVARYLSEGFVFYWNGKSVLVSDIEEDSQNIDLSRSFLQMNADQTFAEVLSYGHDENFFENVATQFITLLQGKKFVLNFVLDEQALQERLQREFQEIETPSKDAFLEYDTSINRFVIQPEEEGKVFDYTSAFSDLRTNILRLRYEPVMLRMKDIEPMYAQKDLLSIIEEANKISEKLPVHLVSQEKTWTLQKSDIAPWFVSEVVNGNIQLAFRSEKALPFFSEIEKEVGVTPKNAKFQLEGEKVKEFQPSTSGKGVDVDASLQKILTELQKETEEENIELVLKDIPPLIESSAVNNLGIRELLGVGYSNFKGSPKNRRHNIQVGSQSVHGTLIAPEEEFSLLNVLGEIDGSTGYLPELVIKGNRTIPEYGGGLCQVGTTSFRAAMAAGLPVLERQNHSYSVSYYLEDGLPGTDATIYPPHPDFRFLNDTGNYVLFQTRIEGDNLYYELWGTKDGRVANRTKPEVWDVISPPATKIIETTDLAPGKKKCTEKAHKGMKAKFDYLVKYASGEEKKQSFYSNYRAWQEVCLLGVEPTVTENAPQNGAL